MGGEFPCVSWPWKKEKEICCSLVCSPTHDLFPFIPSFVHSFIHSSLSLLALKKLSTHTRSNGRSRLVFIAWDTIDRFGKWFKGQVSGVQGSETWSRNIFAVLFINLWSWLVGWHINLFDANKICLSKQKLIFCGCTKLWKFVCAFLSPLTLTVVESP